jgi:hypothetical protein
LPVNPLKFSPVITGLPDRFSISLRVLPATAPPVYRNHFQTVTICHGFITLFFQPLFQFSPVCA